MTTYKKLRIWARYLEREVPVEKLNRGDWHCRTAACAGGHACMIPRFREMGLGLGPGSGWLLYPVYEDVIGSIALMEFFGTSSAQMTRIVFPGKYPTKPNPIPKSHVIKRIRELAETYKDVDEN